MEIAGWEDRYRNSAGEWEHSVPEPTPLVRRFAGDTPNGTALDLAAGTGRNALWLAQRGWKVTAVDGAPSAIRTIENRSASLGISLESVVADLQGGEFHIRPESWDLITICYYLQRSLFEPVKLGIRPGGRAIVIVHTTEGDEEPTGFRLRPGELACYFSDWNILHSYEGKPEDPEHRRSVAEIVACKPER